MEKGKNIDIITAQKRIEELRNIIIDSNERYYVHNAPVISDYDYDHLLYELADLEKLYPELDTPDSPTHRVGSDLDTQKGKFARKKHKYPMLSLSNTYNINEVKEFAARAEKTLNSSFSYSCELKFDGTAICLAYKNGKLVEALTRGDGIIGDDVTRNIKKISNIPHQLKGEGFPEYFEIRGEILMPYAAFDRLNEEKIRNEEQPFANPRNAASGSLKLQDPKEINKRGLWCTLYHVPTQCCNYETHKEALDAAASWGLPVSDKRQICHNIDEIEKYIEYWDSERKELPYATDGIVVKINEMPYQALLGYTAKSPRWAVAYKFKAEEALTQIESIDYQVGRTGAVTPVANLTPVLLSGTIVKRATLNNAEQMELLDIHEGDFVYVEKGGEIIPKITRVELDKRKKNALKPVFPDKCPDCGTELIKEDDQAKHYCPNVDGCPMQIKGKMLHFTSRKAMDILAGEATIEQLFDKDLARRPSELYNLTLEQLLTLEGWKKKSAENFLESLQKSKNVPFERVLFSIGIRYVGETTARSLAMHFKNIEALAAASKDELLEVEDVGEVIADSILSYFSDEQHKIEIEALKKAGLKMAMEDSTSESGSNTLEGLTIVISGNFSISRNEMKQLILNNGGKNTSSISGKTSYLLAGEKPGPEKIKKAEKLNVPIIDEAAFNKLINISTEETEEIEQIEPTESSEPTEPIELTLF